MPKKNKKNPVLEVPKPIRYTFKLLSSISSNLTVKFAAKLFITPIKHKRPKREDDFFDQSKKVKLLVPKINKEIMVYQFGASEKKILLVHGWSGRGTYMAKIAQAVLNKGYSTISFDAPAHGLSSGKTTMMPEFIASIHEINKKHGPFEFAIGHSLGGMSVFNALAEGFEVKKAICISSGDKVEDITKDFIKKLELPSAYAQKLTHYFESKLSGKMEDYASYKAVQKTTIPILIIHDKDDIEVPVYTAKNIHQHAKNSTLFLTENLGHRKILADENVIQKIVAFLD